MHEEGGHSRVGEQLPARPYSTSPTKEHNINREKVFRQTKSGTQDLRLGIGGKFNKSGDACAI